MNITENEAATLIATYTRRIKAWTATLIEEDPRVELDKRKEFIVLEDKLRKAAAKHPKFAPQIDLLLGLRTRSLDD